MAAIATDMVVIITMFSETLLNLWTRKMPMSPPPTRIAATVMAATYCNQGSSLTVRNISQTFLVDGSVGLLKHLHGVEDQYRLSGEVDEREVDDDE